MNTMTTIGVEVPEKAVEGYLDNLINQFFKILPIKENNPASLSTYLQSFQIELAGFQTFFVEMDNDPHLVTLLNIIQGLLDNEYEQKIVKREVFRAITICKKMKEIHCKAGE